MSDGRYSLLPIESGIKLKEVRPVCQFDLGLSAEGSEFQTDTHVSVQGVNHHPPASCHLQTLFTLPDSHNIGSDIQK